MEKETIKRKEILLAKLEEAKRRKQENASILIEELSNRYEKSNGKKANYVFVL